MSVYMIGAVEVHDPEGYELYRANVPETISPYLGDVHFLSSDDHPLVREGAQPANHLFIHRFSSIEVLEEFYYSEAYQGVVHYRHESAATKYIMVMNAHDEPLGEGPQSAYIFAAVEIRDVNGYELYREHAARAIAAFPEVRVLSSDDHPMVLEGMQPASHLVLAHCPSVDSAKAFYDSDLLQAAIPYRRAASDARFFMIMRGTEKTS